MTLSILDKEPAMATTRPYLSTSATSLVATVVLLAGMLAAAGGIAYWINGLTHVSTEVVVPVEVQQGVTTHWFGSDSSAWASDAVHLPDAGLPSGVSLQVAPGDVSLTAWDSTLVEQALARAGYVVLGLACLVVALLLRRVLVGLERGDPFSPGNARRISLVAVTIAVTAVVVPTLNALAAAEVIRRLGLDPGTVAWHWNLDLAALLAAALVLAVAESFRRGELLRDDVAGLV
jgi:hypothetical protein